MAISALALAVVSIGACARNDNDGTDIGTARAPDSVATDTMTTNRAGQAAMQDSTTLNRDTTQMSRDSMSSSGSSATTTTPPQSSGSTSTTSPQSSGTTTTTAPQTGTTVNPNSSSSVAAQAGDDIQRDRQTADAAGTLGVTSGMSDAAIMGLLDAADRADSASGSIAVEKASSADVRAYGRKMMEDHHRMREHGQLVARQANITPQPPTDHPVIRMAQQGMQQLQAASRGQEFDRVYVDNQVRMHRQVLETARQAQQQAQNPALKQHLQAGEPELQEHLRDAEALQQKLGGQ